MFGSQNMLTAVNNFTKTHYGLVTHPTQDSKEQWLSIVFTLLHFWFVH